MCCAKACYKRPKKTTSCGGHRFRKNQIRGPRSPEGVQPSPASHSFPKSLNGVATEGKTDVTGKEMAKKKKSIIQQGMNSFRGGRDPLAESGRYREARCSRSGKQRWRDRRWTWAEGGCWPDSVDTGTGVSLAATRLIDSVIGWTGRLALMENGLLIIRTYKIDSVFQESGRSADTFSFPLAANLWLCRPWRFHKSV